MMDLDEAITVTKLIVQGDPCYLMVGWQSDSFEVYLFNKEKLWKGRFSPNRLVGFSKNLHMSEVAYFANVKRSLSQSREDYIYELKSGFFYWKRKIKGSVIIEGFLPMELDPTPKHAHPDLIEVLVALNKHMKQKVHNLKSSFQSIKSDYQKCLRDTEEFLNLKIEMEKALCDKFLSLLSVKRSKVNSLKLNRAYLKDQEMLDLH
ncbi:uncharacterized protein LOC111350564 [Spodoptera litura]|uniref:Uncharacterized protein LOC111350564 n=1 Tax=Spodoptera litura TaxID=69820 RepID=A0A9J7DYB1_SPOLT|nr:uncharacterized protein LOC111350564 [Spodoptera litura]